MAKDFSNLAGTGVLDELSKSTAKKSTTKKSSEKRSEATREEQEQRAALLQTQGRKGCKLPRITLAFTPDNHQFVKTVSRATGQTATEYVNAIIDKYKQEHPEIYKKALELVSETERSDK